MVDTWNNVTETYTAIKMDVTDTASAANSLLLDLQVDGVSKFSVDKTGVITVGGPVPLANFQDNGLSGEVLYNSGVVLASSATGVDITGDLDVTGNLDDVHTRGYHRDPGRHRRYAYAQEHTNGTFWR
jgi:hypothetical protein